MNLGKKFESYRHKENLVDPNKVCLIDKQILLDWRGGEGRGMGRGGFKALRPMKNYTHLEIHYVTQYCWLRDEEGREGRRGAR